MKLNPFALIIALIVALSPLANAGEIVITHSELTGIGAEDEVMRRDPSDVIKVGDLFYVWYSKGKISPGYDATLWYATSPDGKTKKGSGRNGTSLSEISGEWD